MNKMILLILSYALGLFSIIGCGKNETPPPPPDPVDTITPPLTLLWKNNFDSTPGIIDSIYRSQNPLVYQNDVIYSIDRVHYDVNARIVRADGLTGDIKWKNRLPHYRVKSLGLWENRVIVHSGNITYCLDAGDGSLIWVHNVRELYNEHSSSAAMKVIDGFVYLSSRRGSNPTHEYARMFRIDINTGTDEEIVRYYRNYEISRSPYITPPVRIISDEGDEILYYVVLWDSAADPFVDYYAYNMTKKEVLWVEEKYDRMTEHNYSPMAMDHYVYYVGWNMVHCFHAFTGEHLWSTHMPKENDHLFGFFYTEPFIHNGTIVMKPVTRSYFAIDAKTGDLKWELHNTLCSNVRYFVPYKDNICFDCSPTNRIFMKSLETGELKFWYRSPHKNEAGEFGYDGIAVDEERGLLYANDGIYFMCFRINEE